MPFVKIKDMNPELGTTTKLTTSNGWILALLSVLIVFQALLVSLVITVLDSPTGQQANETLRSCLPFHSLDPKSVMPADKNCLTKPIKIRAKV